MKFGKTLATSIYEPWRDKYIDYDKIKKLLREDEFEDTTKDTWSEQDEETFINELTNVELEKVNHHQVETAKELERRVKACEDTLQPVAGTGEDGNGNTEEEAQQIAEETLKELDKISEEISELKKFSRINYTGFLKAAKKHDRKRGTKYRARPLLQVRLAQLPFNSEDYSPLLYRLSALYSFSRQIIEGKDESRKESMSSQRPKDTYTAHKFWVHADNLLEVKTYILRRLPVLVYNPQASKTVDSSRKDPTTTSIYFDNPNFDVYSQKVDQPGEAGSLRLRWSGQLNSEPEIMLEKKVVSETAESKEIRLPIKQKYILPFLNGEYKMEKQIKKLEERLGADSEYAKALRSNVEEILEFIKEKQLEPVLRASYTRTAFQIPGNDNVRISLDTDVAFIREDSLDPDRPCREPGEWHRLDVDTNELEYPYSSLKKGEISRFEHAILEIKVKDSKSTRNNAWLADLMSSHLLKEAPKFSKFVHGVAELFEDHVNSFPFWLSELETDIRRDPQEAFKEEQQKLEKKAADEFAVGSFLPESLKSTASPRPKGKLGSPSIFPESRAGQLSPMVNPRKSSQLAVTAEEQDDGDDPVHLDAPQIDITNTAKTGFALFFPSFSNSRYAQRHRKGAAWEDAPLPPGVKDPGRWIKDQGPVKVEAKVWLANQRTFIKWQHIAVLLASLSLGLYNAAGVDNNVARALALVYTAFAVFAGLWGWVTYLWRSKLIHERSGKDFDYMIGPFVVSLGLAAALVLNFAFKYSAAVADTVPNPSVGSSCLNESAREELLQVEY